MFSKKGVWAGVRATLAALVAARPPALREASGGDKVVLCGAAAPGATVA